MGFLSSPNLPRSRVTLMAFSAAAAPVAQWLSGREIRTILLPADNRMAVPVRFHADLLLHHLGGNALVLANARGEAAQRLRAEGFCTLQAKRKLSSQYPQDVPLCALRIGNYLFAKRSSLDPAVEQYCGKQGVALIDSPQGYARCSVLVLRENAAVTADSALAKAMESVGISVLRIRPGFICLPGYSCGFLGGCCGLIAPDLLLCNGDISLHPDGKRITEFAARYGIRILSAHPGELIDIGGILPLKESEI